MLTYQFSYWDAQIWAAARLNQVPVVLTEDLPGQQYIEGVRYKNPFL
jgi:predicted nucleic acid-binding protein